MALLLTLLGVVAAISQPPAEAAAANASTLRLGPPAVVAEIDLSKTKGVLRRLSWSPDATQLYVQTAEEKKAGERLHHFVVPAEGGSLTAVADEPAWAREYWIWKSDRSAPGAPSLAIDVAQTVETMKMGTGSAGALDRTSSGLGGENLNVPENVERAAQNRKVAVVRLTLLGEVVSEFIDERAIPGLMFGWGPSGSALIAYTDRDGHLTLLDRDRHRQTVSGVKDARLPAWSADGSHLAYMKKGKGQQYTLLCSTVTR